MSRGSLRRMWTRGFIRIESGQSGMKDRGVKKAPFVVLIGAQMPSILAEISFLTNPDDAEELSEGSYRQRIAEAAGCRRRAVSAWAERDSAGGKAKSPAKIAAKDGEEPAGQ